MTDTGEPCLESPPRLIRNAPREAPAGLELGSRDPREIAKVIEVPRQTMVDVEVGVYYREMRANLWATDGDFERAKEITRISYAPWPFFAPDAWDLRDLSGEHFYLVMEELSRRYPGRSLQPGPDDDAFFSILDDLGVPLPIQRD